MILLKKFIYLSFHEKKMTLLAFWYSFVAWLIVTFLPLKYYSRYLGKLNHTFNTGPALEQTGMIVRAVFRSSKYAPWNTRCLINAIAGKFLMNRYRIPSTLYLGVAKEQGSRLIAHAWLKSGDQFITGRRGSSKFTVVSTFA